MIIYKTKIIILQQNCFKISHLNHKKLFNMNDINDRSTQYARELFV